PDVEYRIIRPNGEVRVVYSRGSTKIGASGKPHQRFGTIQDITDRKRAEEALQRTQLYLNEAQRLAHMGSWVLNVADRKLVHLSEEWYRVFGFDPAEGPPSWEKRFERTHPDDRLHWKNTLERAICEKTDYDKIFRIVLPE